MKLEDLPGILQELKGKLLRSVKEDAAPVANDAVVTELRKRILITKNPVRSITSTRPAGKKLNEQQSKFLKQVAPAETDPSNPVPIDAIQVQTTEDGYAISIDTGLPQTLKDRAIVTDADVLRYEDTLINEIEKNQAQQL